MTSLILTFGLLPFGLAFLLNVPRMLRQIKGASASVVWLGIAWTAMFVGQAQMFGHEQEATGVSRLGAGALYQLSWMGVAGVILAFMAISTKTHRAAWRFPLLALLVFAILGIAGSAGSMAPQLAAYKAFQVVMDAMLSIMALSTLIYCRKPRVMIELSYFLLILLVASAALGGLIIPEQAFKVIGFSSGSGGTFGAFLQGVHPMMSANELGLMSGILVIVSLRRAFEPDKLSIRIFWVSVALLGASVALLAQSRTSLASSLIALIIMSLSIKRMRMLAILLVVGISIILASALVQRTGIMFADNLAEYVRRGSTDEQLRNLSGRTILFERGLKMSADRPLLGYGFETGARFAGEPYGIARGSNMHNAHIQVIVDSGYIGYLVWLGFLLSSVWIVWARFWRYHRGLVTEDNRFHLECALVVFIIFFRSFFGHVLVSHQQNLLIFLAILISYMADRYLMSGTDASKQGQTRQRQSSILSRKVEI